MDKKEQSPAKGIESFSQLESLFAALGVKQIFVKHLPQRQDNEKNQVVLGSRGASNLLSLLPAEMRYRAPSTSSKKRNSKVGEPIVEMILDFYWLYADGTCWKAPEAKVINYFQYPEARFSGFFKNCGRKPGALRRKDRELYSKRIFVFGASFESGSTYGMVLTNLDDAIVQEFPVLPEFELVPVLHTHILGSKSGQSPRTLLLEELKEIAGEWHPGVTLKKWGGPTEPCNDNRGGGLTLEALLNIPANALKEPDKYGYEIKSFRGGGKISLMTPTADKGEEGRMTFRDFMRVFGWPPVRSKSVVRVFNGRFKYRKAKDCAHIGKSLILDIEGYEPITREFAVEDDAVYLSLKDNATQVLISGWSMDKLLSSWNEKHAAACYVEYEKRRYRGSDPSYKWEYRYSGKALLGEGTDIWKYLRAVSEQIVYYDPAHDIAVGGKPRQRPQWRLEVKSNFEEQLSVLYDSVFFESLIE